MRKFFTKTSVIIGEHQYVIGAREWLHDWADEYLASTVAHSGEVPAHIAFCMDGNRRYARNRNIPRNQGHIEGFAAMVRVCVACSRLGVRAVTVYAFSIENFNRSKEESQALFDLVRTNLWNIVHGQDTAAQKMGWRVRFPGNRAMLAPDIVERIEAIEGATANNTGMLLNICAPYTTRDDLAHAIATSAAKNRTLPEDFDRARYLADAGPLDMFVRTSGETRLSDFMVWEIGPACAIEFVPMLWPEFKPRHLYTLIAKWRLTRKKGGPLAYKSLQPAPPNISVSKKAAK